MPELVIGSAFRERGGAETYTMPDGTVAVQQWDWEEDQELYGCGICACEAGTELAKADVALALGFRGDDPATTRKPKSAWDKNKAAIMALLEGVFGDGHSNRWLRRL
jgi:hypothetical protein